MTFLTELLIKSFIETLHLTGMIILIGLLLGMLRNNSIRNLQMSFGSKAVIITGFIGVPIHELSHAIFSLLFGHQITEIKLLQRPDERGVMGYVKHSYNPSSIYQQIGNFFIGIAPIFGGVISIIALMYFIIPESYNQFINILSNNLAVTTLNKNVIEGMLNSYGELIKTIFTLKNFQDPYFFLFLFIGVSISSHISLSTADIKGAAKGLLIIFVLILVINAIGLSKYILAFNIMKYNVLVTGFLLISIIFSVITFLISLILRVIFHR